MRRRCNLYISYPSTSVKQRSWDTEDRHTNANGDKPVRQLHSQATITVKKIVTEHVAGSTLAEWGDRWGFYVSSVGLGAKGSRHTVGNYSALLLYSMVVITPPYVLRNHNIS